MKKSLFPWPRIRSGNDEYTFERVRQMVVEDSKYSIRMIRDKPGYCETYIPGA